MATANGTGVNDAPVEPAPSVVPEEAPAADRKGKGKAAAVAEEHAKDVAMDEADDDEEDEDEAVEDAEEDDEEGGDAEGAIDLNNVVSRRTRGKVIDFAKAAEENPGDDEDDEDDGDFEEEDEDMGED